MFACIVIISKYCPLNYILCLSPFLNKRTYKQLHFLFACNLFFKLLLFRKKKNCKKLS